MKIDRTKDGLGRHLPAGHRWIVDEVRPATLYGNDAPLSDETVDLTNVKRRAGGMLMVPGFLLSAHKDAQR